MLKMLYVRCKVTRCIFIKCKVVPQCKFRKVKALVWVSPKKKFRYHKQYHNFILVSVPDTETWFWLQTIVYRSRFFSVPIRLTCRYMTSTSWDLDMEGQKVVTTILNLDVQDYTFENAIMKNQHKKFQEWLKYTGR